MVRLFPIYGLFFLILNSSCKTMDPYYYLAGRTFQDRRFVADLPAASQVDPHENYSLMILRPKHTNEKFPLILSFHGTGHSDGTYILAWERGAAKKRFMVLTPNRAQPFRPGSHYIDKVMQLLDEIVKKEPIQQDQVFLSGASSGTIIVRELLKLYPDRWKGAIFIATPASPGWIERVDPKSLPPLLYVHGGQDRGYPLQTIQEEAAQLRKKGVEVSTLFDQDGSHEHKPIWNRKIFEWIENPQTFEDAIFNP